MKSTFVQNSTIFLITDYSEEAPFPGHSSRFGNLYLNFLSISEHSFDTNPKTFILYNVIYKLFWSYKYKISILKHGARGMI
jgi:hypothetical protein